MAFLMGFDLYLTPSSFSWQTSQCHGSPISWVSIAARAASSLMTFPALFTRTCQASADLQDPQPFTISVTWATHSYYLLSDAAILKRSLDLQRPYFPCAQLRNSFPIFPMKYRFHPKDVHLFVIATGSSVPAAHRFCTNTSHKHLLVQLQGLYSPLKSHVPALRWFLFCQNSYIPSSHYNSLLNTYAHTQPTSMAFPAQSSKYFHSLPTKLYKWSGPSQQHPILYQFFVIFYLLLLS